MLHHFFPAFIIFFNVPGKYSLPFTTYHIMYMISETEPQKVCYSFQNSVSISLHFQFSRQTTLQCMTATQQKQATLGLLPPLMRCHFYCPILFVCQFSHTMEHRLTSTYCRYLIILENDLHYWESRLVTLPYKQPSLQGFGRKQAISLPKTFTNLLVSPKINEIWWHIVGTKMSRMPNCC